MDKLTKALLCARAGMENSLNRANDTTFNVGNIAFVVCSFVILLGFIVPMGTERPDTVLGGRLCISSKWSISTGVRNLGTGLHCMDWWFRSHTSHFFTTTFLTQLSCKLHLGSLLVCSLVNSDFSLEGKEICDLADEAKEHDDDW